MSTYNDKVVYFALSRVTTDRELIKQAFLSWQTQFADSKLDVFAFVDHIESFLGLGTAEKKVLMMSMHSASAKGEDTLKEVPAYITGAGGSGANEAKLDVSVDVKPPCVALAQIYFNGMTAGMQRMGNKNMVELAEILNDESLPGASKDVTQALRSLDGTEINLPKSMTEDDCKSLCHEMYVLICDLVGPIVADDLSYKATSNMLDASEASRYDPKNLI